MSDFLNNLKLEKVSECMACGERPHCEETLQVIIDGFPLDDVNGEYRPILPRDAASQNFCVEAIARIAACRANRGMRKS